MTEEVVAIRIFANEIEATMAQQVLQAPAHAPWDIEWIVN